MTDDGCVTIDDPELAREITHIASVIRRDGAIHGHLVSERAARWMAVHCWNCRRRKLACQCIWP
jgi:hypothetical protein